MLKGMSDVVKENKIFSKKVRKEPKEAALISWGTALIYLFPPWPVPRPSCDFAQYLFYSWKGFLY